MTPPIAITDGPTQEQVDAWFDECGPAVNRYDYIARRAHALGVEQERVRAICAVDMCPNTHSDQRKRIIEAIRKGEK